VKSPMPQIYFVESTDARRIGGDKFGAKEL
jgi:hypothetical protein